MFFNFIKYLSPIWYFQLSNKGYVPYVVDFSLLIEVEKQIIKYDSCYSDDQISKLDAAYQAFQKGIIKTSKEYQLKITTEPTISDNYRFIKKYFHPFWVFYILVIRILGLKNPITEIAAAFKTLKVARVNLFDTVNSHTEFGDMDSKLIMANPKVSIIIPTLNRYNYLNAVLKDLEKQTYKNFEVIIYDQSNPFDESFYKNWSLALKVVYQQERALWLARNSAIKQSTGDFILLYDDDSLVEADWIEQHLRCIEYFNADISSGVSISVHGAKVPLSYSFFRWSDQVDTGNVMIKRAVFETTGLFDRQFEKQRQGDGEWGLRAYLAGFRNISNPLSKRIHLKVSEGGLREMGSWDGFRPKKLFAPRPIPSVLYLTRKYFGNSAALRSILINVPPSLIPYKYKRSKLLVPIGLLVTLVLLPIVIYTVLKSWIIASKMLADGAKIPSFLKA